jgi:hypothetical protein
VGTWLGEVGFYLDGRLVGVCAFFFGDVDMEPWFGPETILGSRLWQDFGIDFFRRLKSGNNNLLVRRSLI